MLQIKLKTDHEQPTNQVVNIF